MSNQRRKGRKADISRAMIRQVMERDGYKCVWCGRTHVLNIDHIIPVSKGGPTTINNLQVLCNVCDSLKGNSILSKEEGLAGKLTEGLTKFALKDGKFH